SIPRGQWDASLSLGMTQTQGYWRVVVPEAVRVMLPTAGNQFVNVIKASALVSVVGGGDFLTRAQASSPDRYRPLARSGIPRGSALFGTSLCARSSGMRRTVPVQPPSFRVSGWGGCRRPGC